MSGKFSKGEVYMIGESKVNCDELGRYLCSIGATGWRTDAPSSPELLAEVYGRLCYRSFGVGLNKNITRVREGNKPYLANINKVNHGAVLEHSVINFIFGKVSRIFTHELVRHRVGIAISQESMRYVRIDDIQHYESMLMDDQTKAWFLEHALYTEALIAKLESHHKIDKMEFSDKKKYTSLFRRIAPDGILTSMGWSANLRTLRHVIPLRTSRHAEEEIRGVFDQVAMRCKALYPNVFADFKRTEVDGIGEWASELSNIQYVGDD
jgi:thymidylate synthase (FAD)